MVDISMEILASSVPIRNGYMPRYRVKTWWTHIDVPPDVTYIKLPRLPMIQPFLIMTGKDTTIFVETWQDHQSAIVGSGGGDGGIPMNKTSFLGMTTCSVDEQLKTPNLNPSVQWLEVHDPIEDDSKGKLLIKVDAKFVIPEDNSRSPARPNNSRDHQHRPSTHEESPIKMLRSPRRNNLLDPNFPYDDYNNDSSPAVQSVTSRKSDTSVYSIHSVSSTRSQEQGVQTDLSLPVITGDMSKFTSGFNPKSSSTSSAHDTAAAAAKKFLSSSKQSSKSVSEVSSVTSAPVVPKILDPLKFAEDILMRNLHTHNNNNDNNFKSNNQRRISEPVPAHSGNKHQPQMSSSITSSAFRRSCLVRQHVQLQESQLHRDAVGNNERQRTPSRNYDMESIEDVIDMLNSEKGEMQTDSVFSSPTTESFKQIPKGNSIKTTINQPASSKSVHSNKPPRPSILRSTMQSGQKDKISGITNLTTTERGTGEGSKNNNSNSSSSQRVSISSNASSGSQLQRKGSSSEDTVKDTGSDSYHPTGRFREIHFDGAEAKQQATSILMTRTTAQSTTHPPVVTRRRIAAAIFDD